MYNLIIQILIHLYRYIQYMYIRFSYEWKFLSFQLILLFQWGIFTFNRHLRNRQNLSRVFSGEWKLKSVTKENILIE